VAPGPYPAPRGLQHSVAAGLLARHVHHLLLFIAYSVWSSVLQISRRVQGRLNDLGLLCASSAARTADHQYTSASAALLDTIARYVRLFSVLFYASVSTRFAPLLTPQGLEMLVEYAALTVEERDLLLESDISHTAILGWLWATIANGLRDGRLPGAGAPLVSSPPTDNGEEEEDGQRLASTAGVVEPTGLAMLTAAQLNELQRASRGGGCSTRAHAAPAQLQMLFEQKFLELRSTFATVSDTLSGRMPLAYAQLVQILVDMLVIATPFALLPAIDTLGVTGVILGTGVITFFYSSVLNLAKVFLDPYDNESYGGRLFGIAINVGTLMQETNVGSRRYLRAAAKLPSAARPTRGGAPGMAASSDLAAAEAASSLKASSGARRRYTV